MTLVTKVDLTHSCYHEAFHNLCSSWILVISWKLLDIKFQKRYDMRYAPIKRMRSRWKPTGLAFPHGEYSTIIASQHVLFKVIYIMQFMQQNKRNLYKTYSKRRLFVHQVRDQDRQKWREENLSSVTPRFLLMPATMWILLAGNRLGLHFFENRDQFEADWIARRP